MKSRDEKVGPVTPKNAAPPNNLTAPDIATTRAVQAPAAIPIGESSHGNLTAATLPTPPTWTRGEPTIVRPGLGGDPMPLIDQTGAPTPDPRYQPVAREYTPPASNLPMQVSAAQIASKSLERTYNMGPADSEATAPILAGTKVVGSLDSLRRAGGGN